jgi:benzodiazapine receptor
VIICPIIKLRIRNNKKMIYRLIIFLALNFAALAIGGLFTSKGVPSDWYVSIAKAPWTPPGWVFGTAWTTIMICFGVYMAYLWPVIENKNILIGLYAVQWILNVGWNPTFFYYHNVLAGLLLICGLTCTYWILSVLLLA